MTPEQYVEIHRQLTAIRDNAGGARSRLTWILALMVISAIMTIVGGCTSFITATYITNL